MVKTQNPTSLSEKWGERITFIASSTDCKEVKEQVWMLQVVWALKDCRSNK
jgi:hypothetical protein